MPNTKSAEKALRQSKRKQTHNLFWKRRVKDMVKTVTSLVKDTSVTPDLAIIKKEESLLYKVVDKAAKVHAIHKNKASRLKSKVSKLIVARTNAATAESKPVKSKPTRAKKAAK